MSIATVIGTDSLAVPEKQRRPASGVAVHHDGCCFEERRGEGQCRACWVWLGGNSCHAKLLIDWGGLNSVRALCPHIAADARSYSTPWLASEGCDFSLAFIN